VLEEDIAMTNIALDLVGQARMLLTHAGNLEGIGRDEDALAYFRDIGAFRNFTICELPDSGVERGHAHSACYAFTVVRNLLFCAWQAQAWAALMDSADRELAAIAAKSAKETAYHLRHAGDWVVRFGDGTDESHARAQRALDALAPYCNELFAPDPVEEAVAALGIGVRGADLKPGWSAQVKALLDDATLELPAQSAFLSTGKTGLHSEHFEYLVAEMQSLARAHPGAQW
jgi:ring-1,2-phenylacetyl-CoA epoxidase subunit PaaC